MKNISCLRCSANMKFVANQKLQLGQTGWVLGDLPNLLAGAMEVSVYTCPECRRIEFFQTEQEKESIAMRKCPECGHSHEYDYPKCPFCKHDYYN